MEGINSLLKRRIHPMLVLLISLSLILLSFITVNYYKSQIFSRYSSIVRVTEKAPSWPRPKTNTPNAQTSGASNESASQSQATDSPIQTSTSSWSSTTPKDSPLPTNQTGSTAGNADSNQSAPPATQPQEPEQPSHLICVLGVCI